MGKDFKKLSEQYESCQKKNGFIYQKDGKRFRIIRCFSDEKTLNEVMLGIAIRCAN